MLEPSITSWFIIPTNLTGKISIWFNMYQNVLLPVWSILYMWVFTQLCLTAVYVVVTLWLDPTVKKISRFICKMARRTPVFNSIKSAKKVPEKIPIHLESTLNPQKLRWSHEVPLHLSEISLRSSFFLPAPPVVTPYTRRNSTPSNVERSRWEPPETEAKSLCTYEGAGNWSILGP